MPDQTAATANSLPFSTHLSYRGRSRSCATASASIPTSKGGRYAKWKLGRNNITGCGKSVARDLHDLEGWDLPGENHTCSQPPTVACEVGALSGHVPHRMHGFFARSAPICLLGRCLVAKFLRRELRRKYIMSALLVGQRIIRHR